MRYLIVNADDFGLTDGVSRAIIDGHNNGIITSTTLMANGLAFDSAAAASLETPTLGVGVHLNLTEGRPVSAASEVPSIVTPEGLFYPTPGTLARRILVRKVKPLDVETELRNQIEKVMAAGIRITHLDSHKHIHLLPPLFGMVTRLARHYRIDCIRFPVEPASSALGPLQSGRGSGLRMAKQYLLARALSTLAASQVRNVAHAGLYRTDHFYGLSQTEFLDSAILEQTLRAVADGTSELMCHPGYVDEALLATRTRLRAHRETELAALTAPATRKLIADLGIELISYKELPATSKESVRKSNETVPETIRKG